MASNPIPEKLINFRVYLEGDPVNGVADVELPKLKSMTTTVEGAGIFGQVESPVLGHLEAISVTVNFRMMGDGASKLMAPKAHLLDFRGSQQISDAGSYSTKPMRLTMKGTPTEVDLGKLKVGESTESSIQFSVSYLKLYVDGVEWIEVDQFNGVYRVDGVDYSASVRADLGI